MRSLMVDDEVCGVFYENELVSKYNCIYEKDIQHCKPYTWIVVDKHSRFAYNKNIYGKSDERKE